MDEQCLQKLHVDGFELVKDIKKFKNFIKCIKK